MKMDLDWKEISVREIRLPSGEYANLSIPCEEYLFDRFRIGEDEKELFSPEAAELLATLHPIIIWSAKKYCVFGIRTLFIISSIIPASKIKVGILPNSTPDQVIEQFIRTDAWLTRVTFSIKSPEISLFQASRNIPKELLKTFTPGLKMKVAEFSKALGVSIPTLYSGTKKEIIK